eukprot:2500816-Karenia_brevis.AAC.1
MACYAQDCKTQANAFNHWSLAPDKAPVNGVSLLMGAVAFPNNLAVVACPQVVCINDDNDNDNDDHFDDDDDGDGVDDGYGDDDDDDD